MEYNTSSIKVQANVPLEVPPGFEQPPQSYLNAPPGFEVAVASISKLSSTPADIVQTRDQGSFGVQDGGMSLNFAGDVGLSEKASYASMLISLDGNVMEGPKKYGIFRSPTIRVTAIARSRARKSNVRGNGVARSYLSAWVTVLDENDRGPPTFTLFAPFIITVFDGGGNIFYTIVILDGIMKLEHKASRGSTVFYPIEVFSQALGSVATRQQLVTNNQAEERMKVRN